MSNTYDIDLEQDVWFAWDAVKRKSYFAASNSDPNACHKMHSKGDKHLASEQYKADLDANGVKYKIVMTISGDDFRKMYTMWREAMESLGYKWPFSKVSPKQRKKGWDVVLAKLKKD